MAIPMVALSGPSAFLVALCALVFGRSCPAPQSNAYQRVLRPAEPVSNNVTPDVFQSLDFELTDDVGRRLFGALVLPLYAHLVSTTSPEPSPDDAIPLIYFSDPVVYDTNTPVVVELPPLRLRGNRFRGDSLLGALVVRRGFRPEFVYYNPPIQHGPRATTTAASRTLIKATLVSSDKPSESAIDALQALMKSTLEPGSLRVRNFDELKHILNEVQWGAHEPIFVRFTRSEREMVRAYLSAK